MVIDIVVEPFVAAGGAVVGELVVGSLPEHPEVLQMHTDANNYT